MNKSKTGISSKDIELDHFMDLNYFKYENNIQVYYGILKHRVDLIEEKAHLQKELMRINGGYAKNPDIGDKVSDLLIDSIKAKLTIINTLKANAK